MKNIILKRLEFQPNTKRIHDLSTCSIGFEKCIIKFLFSFIACKFTQNVAVNGSSVISLTTRRKIIEQ